MPLSIEFKKDILGVSEVIAKVSTLDLENLRMINCMLPVDQSDLYFTFL